MKTPSIKIKTNPKILLVEDEKIVQMINTLMLKKLGCQVDLAETGEEALAKFKNGYNVIMMDIGLPDKRGTQVAAEIRRTEFGKDIPIIALTAFTGDEIDTECLAAGIDAIYNKPLNEETLKKILQQHLAEPVI